MLFYKNNTQLTTHDSGPSKGFSLVELVVVLLIIGIIVSAVLKLEAVYKNTKITRLINQYRELQAAVLVYKDKYGYLPGDDPYASTHVGTLPAYNGNGDDLVNQLPTEWIYMYYHLYAAGLTKELLFVNPYGGIYLCAHYYKIAGVNTLKNSLRFDNLPADVAQAVDTAIDDGNYSTGFVRGCYLETYIGPTAVLSPSPYTPGTVVPYTSFLFD